MPNSDLDFSSFTVPPCAFFDIVSDFTPEVKFRNVIAEYTSTYTYGFNGKEKDNEVSGEGDSYDYGARMYDPRIGKFFSVDPKSRQFSYYSPYHFAGNSPILNIDLDGLEEVNVFIWTQAKTGKLMITIERTPNTTANSNHGVLLVHNLNTGKTTNEFNYKELNTLFGIDDKSQNVSDKTHRGVSDAKDDYSFALSDPSDLIAPSRFDINSETGTKNVVSFTTSLSSLSSRTVTPYASITGDVGTVASTVGEAQSFLISQTQNLVDGTQKANGQNSSDVKEINITLGSSDYSKIATPDFQKQLKSQYKNAKVNVTENKDSDVGFSIEFKGTEKQQDAPEAKPQ
jgi:RHS repeat-associated protein